MTGSSRRIYFFLAIGFISLVFGYKLLLIQVLDDTFSAAAENNIIRKEIEYPYRGLIYDRYKNLIAYNQPVFDITITPLEMPKLDTNAVCDLFKIDKSELTMRLLKAKRYSYVRPSIFKQMIPWSQFSTMQDGLVNHPGFSIIPRTVRGYSEPVLSNVLGYIGEINKQALKSDTSDFYQQGDYIGRNGLEKVYETELRGQRGVRYKMVNVQGAVKGAFKDGAHDTLSAPGYNLISTIDLELQKYAEKLMKGKVGSIVAIEPSTGEVLAMVSAPTYDPSMLVGKKFSESYKILFRDSLKPLFNRPTMAMYPPGSMFKTVQALIGQQEEVIQPDETINCNTYLIGDHAPLGVYDIKSAIKVSSNNFFFKLMKRIVEQKEHTNGFIDARIGYEKWRNYITSFGLGNALGIDQTSEKKGFVPGIGYYDKYYGINRWRFSNIYSLSIGQGELLVTPLQMANLGAIIANKGFYRVPHLVRETFLETAVDKRNYPKIEVPIDSAYFQVVIDGMREVVQGGSGWRANILDIPVCGKTSTVENPHGADHSGFMGFAPMNNPKIAVAAYVENATWGGRAAASVASLVVEKYINREIKRTWIEDYVLKGDFQDVKKKVIPKKDSIQTDSVMIEIEASP